ncbi:LacI family DNA-binding transcriptional regulator [Tepidibacter formicigenes]|jgi:LacI family transcriptional regulator|uniref:Transcriptional regulator, LacI family n=1 Tax=Tepidibacter formicigenes DSM 15518 TaxID=1123349 RepID=A0A1M6MBD9_9FIRM|nr:LacI family DNA-binding transcriptional regulator [Tepidibacter formicigenes]SHJ80771.1 transcriptional regulator, LacI family [Tepidibacter formicigenes DSM 15518]
MGITIKDIAKFAGVSATTVSKIINNKDENISDATRQRVLDLMKEYNYVPNKIAKSLVTKKTNTIGLVIPDIRNPFFPELARGAEDRANEKGYNIIFCNTDDDAEKEEKYINMLVEKMVDGIVFTASSRRGSEFNKGNKFSVPIVVVDRDIDIEGIKGKVTVDNFIGGYQGTKHLLDLGHREILFLSGPLKSKTSINRLEGYKKALKEFNVDFDEEYVIEGNYKSQWGYEAVKNIGNKIKYTALFCGNDLIAIGAIKALKEMKLKVPDDVSIVGFDDIYMSSLIDPELTTIRQPNYEMGYKAIDILIDALENKEKNVKKIDLIPQLIIRKSTLKR